MKFGRQCTLSVEVDGGNHVEISSDQQNGLTIDFSIDRQGIGSANNAHFTIRNLSEVTRNRIRKDAFALTTFRALQFRAGYDTFNPIVFNGNVKQAYSEKGSGDTDFITTIEGQDGAFAIVNGLTSMGLSAGQSTVQTLKTLASSLPNTAGNPIIGNFPGQNLRGMALMGNTWDLIQEIAGGSAIIDNNQVRVLQPSEAINGDILVIDSAAGLLGSPRRADNKVELEMLFEPRLFLGQTVVVASTTNKAVNGTYKIMGLHHRGTVSPAVSGEAARTTVSLWLPGVGPFSPVNGTPIA